MAIKSLDAHENTIRVGYQKDNLPFCGEENGKLTGILGTVLDTVQEKYKITIKAVPCSTGVEMNEALQSGKIDIAGPIIQDFYTQEQFQVVLTDAIFEDGTTVAPTFPFATASRHSSCVSYCLISASGKRRDTINPEYSEVSVTATVERLLLYSFPL